MSETVRPTKKQREILTYIEQFIANHGYSPSYREIMNGLNYTSVATVSLHVNSLIRRGHLRKRDRSARSLEVISPSSSPSETTNDASQVAAAESAIAQVDKDEAGTKWLVNRIETAFKTAEKELATGLTADTIGALTAIVNATYALGLSEAADRFAKRLTRIADGTGQSKGG